MTLQRTYTVPSAGVGKPDYKDEVFRGKQIYGYERELGEEYLWLTTLFTLTPGSAAITALPIAPGATAQAIDAFTGLTQLNVLAGWDYLLKEFWVSFNQPVRYAFFQGGTYNDVSCVAYSEANAKPTNVFQVGWTRSLLEDLTVASVLRIDITNLSPLNAAEGKVWVIGYRKYGSYIWV
ncbi:MAG: hypothetical protein Q8O40_15760 [Chloroflexota bacterium]|nr:hypothetical protein [Chloroflexota bacterium]